MMRATHVVRGAFERRMPSIVIHRPQGYDYRTKLGYFSIAMTGIMYGLWQGALYVEIPAPSNKEIEEWDRRAAVEHKKLQ